MNQLKKAPMTYSVRCWAPKACLYILPRVLPFEQSGLLPTSFRWGSRVASMLNYWLANYGMGMPYSMRSELGEELTDTFIGVLLPTMPKERLLELMTSNEFKDS